MFPFCVFVFTFSIHVLKHYNKILWFHVKIALGLLAIPAASQIILGFVIYEKKTSEDLSTQKRQVSFCVFKIIFMGIRGNE